MLPQFPNLSDGADSVGGQMRGDKECPFSGARKQLQQSLEEGAGKRCSVPRLAAQVGGDILRHWWKRCPSSDKTFNPNRHGFAHIASSALLQSCTTSGKKTEKKRRKRQQQRNRQNRLHLPLFSLTCYIATFVYIMQPLKLVFIHLFI